MPDRKNILTASENTVLYVKPSIKSKPSKKYDHRTIAQRYSHLIVFSKKLLN